MIRRSRPSGSPREGAPRSRRVRPAARIERGSRDRQPDAAAARHFIRWNDFSFSRQISSTSSVLSAIRCLSVTVHGRV